MNNSNIEESQTSVLTLVTDQFNCERIILSSKQLADKMNQQLYVLNISRIESSDYSEKEHSALEHLFAVSKENGAVMLVKYSDNPSRVIAEYIDELNPSTVITGIPSTQNSVLYKLWTRFPNVAFYTTSQDGVLSNVSIMDKIVT